MNKYIVSYFSGGDQEYQDGIWTVVKTPKRIMAEKIKEEGIYGNHKVGEKIKIGKGTGSPIKYEQADGRFTVYFKQAGTPYIFVPIK